MNVVLYARASSERQAEKGLSIPGQLRELNAFCERSGYVILETFADAGYSGTTDRRPAFQAMVDYCKLHRAHVDAVLVWKSNRFARNRTHAAVYKHHLRSLGVDVLSVTEPKVDGIDGELLEAVVEAMDGRFSRSLAQDVMRGMREVAKRGFYPLSRPPYGYRKEAVPDGRATRYRLVPDENAASLVRRIFTLYVSEGLGAKATAKRLNEQGFSTPTGRAWTTKAVLKVLGNRAYTGCLEVRFTSENAQYLPECDRSVVIENAHPPIVDPETYERARSLREKRSHAHPRELASDYLLSGLLRCKRCGAKMYGVSAKSGTQFYYVCKRFYESGKTQCGSRFVRRDRLDGVVLEKVRDVLLEEGNLSELVSQVNRELGTDAERLAEERKLAKTELKRKETQIERLLDVIEQGCMPSRTATERLKRRETEAEHLRVRVTQLQDDCGLKRVSRLDLERVRPYVESIKETLSNADTRTKQAILRSFLKKVEVGEEELSIEFTIPQRTGQEEPSPGGGAGVLGMVTSGTPSGTRTAFLSRGP